MRGPVVAADGTDDVVAVHDHEVVFIAEPAGLRVLQVGAAEFEGMGHCFSSRNATRPVTVVRSSNSVKKAATMPTRKSPRKQSSTPRKRAALLRAKTSDTRRSPPKVNGHTLTATDVAGRVIRVYAELPSRLAQCRSPFEILLEQWLTGPRLFAALQPHTTPR